ncbi:MAG TPA: ATP-binding cassette domain-containing protein [Pirellulales bacterium]|jgi:urea transport system ATP-binding protein|nr:ATP-binding cassette domain-containing protein [Pirellulales bacterium]
MLTIDRLSFSYGAVQALREVKMTMADGRVTCIMGRNGVGKTTLLKNLMGILRPSSGKVEAGGMDLTWMSSHQHARAGMALVAQGRQIFPKLSVEENLRVGLSALEPPRGMFSKLAASLTSSNSGSDSLRPQSPNGKHREIPAMIYDLFPVLKTMGRRMGGDLSGGQQQQLAIARALVGQPKILLLDEPTEGIQPNIITQIGHVLHHLVDQMGMTVVLVEQYLDFVKEFGHQFYIMNRGRVVAEGPTTDLSPEIIRSHLSV